MARIQGVDIPDNKRGEISLTYIYGIGPSNVTAILEKCGIDGQLREPGAVDELMGYALERLRTGIGLDPDRLPAQS